MKSLLIFVLSGCLLLGCSCSTVRQSQAEGSMPDLEFYAHSASYYADGSISRCRLSDTAWIEGYPCISWVHFGKDGQLKQFKSAQNIQLNDILIPAGSTIFLQAKTRRSIRKVWLSESRKIQGIHCKGGGKVDTDFYENGSLKSCFLPEDSTVQGYPCKGGIFSYIELYPDGKLMSFRLSEDTIIHHTKISKGTRILLDKHGDMQILDK